MRKTRAFIACSGLGIIRRGYESFARELFDHLSDDRSLDLHLLKAGGPFDIREYRIPSLGRYGFSNYLAALATRKPPYYVEQVTFGLSMLPYLAWLRPDVVFTSDGTLLNMLWHYRRATRQGFALILSNGGPLDPPFSRCDLVHQVSPVHRDKALAAGEPPAHQVYIPYAVRIDERFERPSLDDRIALREKLALPGIERPILLQVGALNCSHKRIDYLISEFARLPPPRPYLVIAGQRHFETPEVLAIARATLPPSDYRVVSVPQSILELYYRTADLFTLASLHEGLARASVEALSHGLPCIAHDYDVSRQVFEGVGYLRDLTEPGSLAGAIAELLPRLDAEREEGERRHRSAFERFSWTRLGDSYRELLHRGAEVACRG